HCGRLRARSFHEASEPCATIHDVELNHILGSVQSKPCPLAARVAMDVRQRLLGDPVEGGCSGPGQWLTAILDADVDLNAATLSKSSAGPATSGRNDATIED